MRTHITALLTTAIMLTNTNLAIAAPHAHHEHGIIRLDVAIEGNEINIFMQSPLDSFVGFERAPRTDSEKKKSANALAVLRGDSLLKPNEEAQCKLTTIEVSAPVLEGKAREKNGHADLEANYVFNCANLSDLKSISTTFFKAFKHTKKVEVQIAGHRGQSRATLTEKNSTLNIR